MRFIKGHGVVGFHLPDINRSELQIKRRNEQRKAANMECDNLSCVRFLQEKLTRLKSKDNNELWFDLEIQELFGQDIFIPHQSFL
ncbi:hypothetical protein PHJA_001096500 [Phtheirospermum japonicum]|uniref:Uncharacterized protein n=1 Tax=Phtheirospermum japonicum TaxID=374723 RepID=A0A830BTW8_9LAMI|nr:hypothetical protein PHJA_001096500 [Phtheirospermum japonicum]